jgi:predicted dehydrogenase
MQPDAPRYRGAIIGLGGVARQSHLPGFRLEPASARLEIVAAVDAVATSDSGGLSLLQHRDALRDLELDFVDICTPTASHLELVLWALEQGYHVLCEKPVALSRGEARQIAAAARAAGRVVMPCHQYRFNPAWIALRAALDAGTIGRWHLAEFHVHRLAADRGTSTAASTPWRGLAADARGGVLLDHGSHLIYSLLDVGGAPSALRSWAGRLRHHDYDVEDTAHLLFEYPDRLGIMFLTWAGGRRENLIRFVGDRGIIEWRGGVLTVDAAGKVEQTDFTAQLEKSAYAGWFAQLFAAFADAVDRRDLTSGLADLAGVAAVLEDAYEAAQPRDIDARDALAATAAASAR